MLPCYECAYRREIPGNCHIACTFDWKKSDLKIKADVPRNAARWLTFPYNYDPTWGDSCPAQAKAIEPGKQREFSPMENILSLLA